MVGGGGVYGAEGWEGMGVLGGGGAADALKLTPCLLTSSYLGAK